jgi:cytochrome oxidase assembly protein ShyY1
VSTFRRALLVGTVLLLAGGAVRLAFWQLDRRDTRREANAVLRAGQAMEPLDLATAIREGTPLVGRTATARGSFAPEGDLLLRGRILKKAPGLEVMTPFVLDSGAGQLWVLRGFVKAPDATTPPDQVPPPTPGSVIIRGLLLQIPETTDSGQRLERLGRTTYRRLDRAVAAAKLAGAPAVYLLLDGDSGGPGGLPAVLPPTLDDGPHFSYAIQWFCIAIAILAFGVIALRRADPARPQPPAAP